MMFFTNQEQLEEYKIFRNSWYEAGLPRVFDESVLAQDVAAQEQFWACVKLLVDLNEEVLKHEMCSRNALLEISKYTAPAFQKHIDWLKEHQLVEEVEGEFIMTQSGQSLMAQINQNYEAHLYVFDGVVCE